MGVAAPHVAFYITGHGFGHATRVAVVASVLARQVPGLRISLISTAPEWLFRLNLPCVFQLRPRALDIGVIQLDCLRLTPSPRWRRTPGSRTSRPPSGMRPRSCAATAWAWSWPIFRPRPSWWPSARPAEHWYQQLHLGLIYADYVQALPEYAPILEQIREAYGRADLFLRLPSMATAAPSGRPGHPHDCAALPADPAGRPPHPGPE
jgi:hypothetical protein